MGVDEDVFLEQLRILNIETGNVSFAWLLEEDNDILNWFHNNINLNNCLTAEDKLKFSKLEEYGNVLSEMDLKSELDNLSKKYEGIALPKELNDLAEAKQKVDNLQEWIELMEAQENVRSRLMETNEIINLELSKKLFKLNETVSIEEATLAKLSEDCQDLVLQARDEKLRCYNTIEDVLKLCSASKNSNEKLFFSQMPLDEYFSKTELLATYLKYNVSRQLELFSNNKENNRDSPMTGYSSNKLNEEARLAEVKLKESCEKLKDGLWFYIKSKAELNGVLEQLKFIETYDMDSCFDSHFEKVKIAGMVKITTSDLETYHQLQLPEAIQQFISRQSDQVLLSEMQLRHKKSKYVYDKFCSIESLSREAVNENNIVLMCLKRDQLAVENLLQFSMDTIHCLQSEIMAKKSREMLSRPAGSVSFLLKSLYSFFQIDDQLPVAELNKTIEGLINVIKNLETTVFYEKFANILETINESKLAAIPLQELIWDGPTDQPNLRGGALDKALFEIKKDYKRGEDKIELINKAYKEFKGFTEKNVLHNLWTWFLGDPSKISDMRTASSSRELRMTKPFK